MAENLVVRVQIEGARETLRAFNALPREFSQALRDGNLALSQELAASIQSAARGENAQAALVASTVKARRDRVPSISAGGSKKIGSHKRPAYKILFGSEFGSNELKQFRPHQGQGSYWFFTTVEGEQEQIAEKWNQLTDEILERWKRGG